MLASTKETWQSSRSFYNLPVIDKLVCVDGAGPSVDIRYGIRKRCFFVSMRLWLLLLVLFSLVACGEDAPGVGPTPTRNTTVTPLVPQESFPRRRPLPCPSLRRRHSPTPTSTPEPPSPVIEVAEQLLTDDGRLLVQRVTTLAPGWLVVYADDEGRTGEILGYASVDTGENEEIVVELDPFQATPILHILLHRDDGRAGAFEFPGPDSPMRAAGDIVSVDLEVEIDVLVPALTVSDQEVTKSGEVLLDQVTSPGSGWVALYADSAGEPVALLGQTPVHKGENEEVIIHFYWRQATPRMHVILHHDAGEIGLFEPSTTDEPVEFAGELVTAPFNATLPLDVFVINQPVINDEIVIERVVINEPGWIVVYTDLDGVVNLRIGEAYLEAGINTGVVVPIDGDAATEILHLLLHQDDEPYGEFGHPRSDPPLRYEGSLQRFSLRTDAGNYVITQDQALSSEGTVLVPLVVTDVPTWVIVETDDEGTPGELAGSTWVPAGVNRSVIVAIDPDLITETLHVTLLVDAGVEQELEYPAGRDVPMQRNRVPIRAPFQLLTSAE